MKIVEADKVVKKYGDNKTVLNGISFSVEAGEFVTIYGKSGCGKTTLLNILGGLDRPTSGKVMIDGLDTSRLSEDEMARVRLEKIGFVFQDYNLLMDMTVRENVALPLKFSRRRNTGRVDRLLEKFEIIHLANEAANRISGGEAQRAAIARAMINEPAIILADEPTGNLDFENTGNVMEAFRLLTRDFGTTIILATHDWDLAEFSNARIILKEGQVVDTVPTLTYIPVR